MRKRENMKGERERKGARVRERQRYWQAMISLQGMAGVGVWVQGWDTSWGTSSGSMSGTGLGFQSGVCVGVPGPRLEKIKSKATFPMTI